MSHVLGDLSLAPLLYFGLLSFCTVVAVLAGDKKSERAMDVLRLLLRKGPDGELHEPVPPTLLTRSTAGTGAVARPAAECRRSASGSSPGRSSS